MSIVKSTDDVFDWVTTETQDFVRELSYKVFDGITMRTPVKFGQLRASWNMTKDAPDFSTVDVGIDLPPPVRPELIFEVGEYPLVFFANGKPYAELIENGYSKKAPQGMVQVTLDSLGQ